MVSGGVVYTLAFAFVLIQLAVLIGCGAILVAMVVTFAYCLSLRGKAA